MLNCFVVFVKVECPRHLSSNDLLQCKISGFHDPESGISHYQFFVGTDEGYQDVYESPKIEDVATSYGFQGTVFPFCFLSVNPLVNIYSVLPHYRPIERSENIRASSHVLPFS